MTLQSLIRMVNTPPQPAEKCKRARAWERRKEHRPGELLDAALEVFVARGYAAARLDDVAARAGVSKGTLYLYYAGKEDLFKAVVRVHIVPVIEQFRQRIEQATGSSEELLVNVLTDWWHCFSQPQIGGIIKLIIAEASNFPEIARFFHEEIANTSHAVIRSLLARGVERNEFRTPCDMDVAVHLITSPMVLKLIWAHSVARCGVTLNVPSGDDFMRSHVGLILMMLRDPNALSVVDCCTPADGRMGHQTAPATGAGAVCWPSGSMCIPACLQGHSPAAAGNDPRVNDSGGPVPVAD